ncbi:hypothetical protein [Bradyrhizobium sp. 33ap4]|uniref:hypothetical protein n=1 Tax=Bradyrhizobium sp. 33ap4 TaxID=3061630 RepID=UPI00292F18B7|nr:hypothetical protein [Bradyrhizobium sp. 33ap4]
MTTKSRTQIEKFKKAARDLETDDNEKRFNERLGKIARQKPSDAKVKIVKKKRDNS